MSFRFVHGCFYSTTAFFKVFLAFEEKKKKRHLLCGCKMRITLRSDQGKRNRQVEQVFPCWKFSCDKLDQS